MKIVKPEIIQTGPASIQRDLSLKPNAINMIPKMRAKAIVGSEEPNKVVVLLTI